MDNRNVLGPNGTQPPGSLRQAAFTQARQGIKRGHLPDLEQVLLKARSIVMQGLPKVGHPVEEGVVENGGDPCDLSSIELDRTLSLLLKERDRGKLRAIENALGRIKEGSYGICEDCGEKIPRSRLEAMPFATTCVSCRTRQERYEKMLLIPKEYQLSGDVSIHEFKELEDE